jgi:vanillate O-demethylase monooxygenase subunit
MHYDFLAPAVLQMDSGMMIAGTGGNDENRENALAFRGCQALTPETETSTHYFFAHPHNFLTDRADVTEEIHAGIVHAFEEDRQMITSQQQNIQLDPSFKMVPLGVDAALSQFRWVIDKLIRGER